MCLEKLIIKSCRTEGNDRRFEKTCDYQVSLVILWEKIV